MLYFYKSISPHPIENLHNYLHNFFSKMFDEVNPTYDHAHHIHADFKEIVTEYKAQIDDKLAAIFSSYIVLLPAEKQIVQTAYNNNNNIEGICNKSVKPFKYDELPASIKTPIKSLYDQLWGDNKILGYKKVEDKCGKVKNHFDGFRKVNFHCVCPFCGLDSLLCEHDDGRDDYDHYLPKSEYPFIAVNFSNLFPMCHKCNSKSKGSVDTPFNNGNGEQQDLYFPYDYATVNHKVSLKINAPSTDLSNPESWSLQIDCEPTNIDKRASWVKVFNIEKRYKAIIAKESSTWMEMLRQQYRILCIKGGVSFDMFLENITSSFDFYLDDNKGILKKSFNAFILNDPHCEAKLSNQITIDNL